MYAIVQQGGHQYRVSPGDRLVVDRLEAEVGSVIALEPVLLLQGESGDATLGAPAVDGARVAAVIVAHTKGRKLRVFKYKPKKRYRRTQGHRSLLTELRIEALLAAGEPLPKAAAAAPEANAETARAEEPQAAEPKAEKPKAARSKASAAVEEAPTPEAATAEAEASAPAGEAPKPRARRSRAKKAPAEAAPDAAATENAED